MHISGPLREWLCGGLCWSWPSSSPRLSDVCLWGSVSTLNGSNHPVRQPINILSSSRYSTISAGPCVVFTATQNNEPCSCTTLCFLLCLSGLLMLTLLVAICERHKLGLQSASVLLYFVWLLLPELGGATYEIDLGVEMSF